jgi:DNA-directed RNA polymerase subunit RPC12/RpoP
MTIEFNCPKCGAVIAFDSKHSGRRARCLTCGQKFIIPAQSFEKPEKIASEPEPRGEPIPGFYRAVFVDSWKLFADRENITTLVFVVAVVCFRFFLAPACCLNYLSTFLILGWLFGFYLNIIYRTAIEDDDDLPEIELGTSVTFLWFVIAPFLVFFSTLLLVELPFIIALGLTADSGVTWQNMGSGIGPVHLLLQFLLILGLFLFPSAILATSVGRDFFLLWPSYLLPPIRHAFGPYVTCALLLIAAGFIEMHTTQDTGASPLTTALHLSLNLALQVVAILTMRAIGLFYRHYACYFKW